MSSNEYGYIPEVEQSFGNNTGVFDPADINNLVADNKWTQYGQLELIETQNIAGVSSTTFSNLGDYNVHFITYNDMLIGTDNQTLAIQVSYDGGTSFRTSTNDYQYALQWGRADGTFFESRDTTSAYIPIGLSIGNNTNERGNGYAYLYNMLDSAKYSFSTYHCSHTGDTTTNVMNFGSSVCDIAEVHNAFKVYNLGATSQLTGTISLYGIKEYS